MLVYVCLCATTNYESASTSYDEKKKMGKKEKKEKRVHIECRKCVSVHVRAKDFSRDNIVRDT